MERELRCAQCAVPVSGPAVNWVTKADQPTCSWKCAEYLVGRYLLQGWEVTECFSKLRGIPYFRAVPPMDAVPRSYVQKMQQKGWPSSGGPNFNEGVLIAPAKGPC